MNEPYPGGAGGGYQPHPGGRRQPSQPDPWPDQPDPWPGDLSYGQERGPDPHDVSGERGRRRHQRHGHRRQPDADETTVDQITALDRLAALDNQGPKAGVNWVQRRHQPRGNGRRPELEQTTVDQIVADQVMAGQTAVFTPHERKADLNWARISLDWARNSRNWTLIAGLVFFLFDTFLMADGFARPVAVASRVVVIFIWLISLIALALLWLRGSSKFSVQNPFVRAETGAHQR